MREEGHPFGKLMSRLLGLAPNERPNDSAIDYYIAQRHHFIEKMEGGVANQQVSMMQIVDYTRDFYEHNKSLGAIILQQLYKINTPELS